MPYGFVGKILKVNLTDEKTETLQTAKYFPDYLGGRGIAARISWDEMNQGADPFDLESKLIIMTGPLTGTLAPTSGRTIFCGVSPRVYPRPWYTHSTMGGFFGSELKYAGFDGVLIDGKAQRPVYLWIRDGETEIISAQNLWGKHVRATVRVFRKEHGRDIQVASIGPAGENLVRYAAVSHPPENASGHSGFGAIMGFKNLKAIAVRGTGGVRVARPLEFFEVCRYAMGMCRTGPVDSHLMKGGLPAPHLQPVCSQSCNVDCRIAEIYSNTRSKFHRKIIKAHQAFCVGACWMVKEPQAGYDGPVKVPPITGWDPEDGGVDLHLLCDDLGLDLWILLVLQPWLKRCLDLGLKEMDGEPLKPTDPYWFRDLMCKIAHREGIGDPLAEDLLRMVEILERRGVHLPDDLVRLTKELEFAYGFPAHREGRIWDPEPMPFWVVSALMYATESRDPTICTHASFLHLAELYLDDPEVFLRNLEPISERVWGTEEAVKPSFEHKSELAIWCQHRHILLDCLPLCDFAFPRVIKPFETKAEWKRAQDAYGDLDIEARLLSACTGVQLSSSELEKTCERIFTLERMISVYKFNRNRHVDELVEPHFELPCKTDGTRLDKKTFKRLLDDYYTKRGWEIETGVPTREKLKELGLENPA